jgi:hypothetical protein
MTERLIRLGLVIVALPTLYTGVWALIDPSGWFHNYPGFGSAWTAALGTYNHHLTIDTGAGFLAIGIGLLYALFRFTRPTIRLALVVYLVFSIPHLVFHLQNPSATLSGTDKMIEMGLLLAAVVVPLVMLLGTTRMRTSRFGSERSLLR